MPRALFPLRDPITSVELTLVTLQTVEVTLHINLRPQAPLLLTYAEAREFLTGCIADSVPVVTYNHLGTGEWNDSYRKPQLIDGQGNVVEKSSL